MKREKPTYTPEYRQQAVELSYVKGRNVSSVARDLGISANALHDWRC
jgi:transposase-like protein